MSGWSSYAYTIGPLPRAVHRLSTSRTEIVHLLIASIVLTVDFALLSSRFLLFSLDLAALLPLFGLAAATALTGFVFHEMAHKVVAQRHGYWAEFRMSPTGLFLSLVTAFIGFLFASPGATVIGGMAEARDWGRTSLAGPMLNLGEGAAFLGSAFLLSFLGVGFGWIPLLLLLAFFNGWFGTFNLIPIGPLDGRKVLRWSLPVWAISFAVSAAFSGFLYWILYTPSPLF